MSRTLSLTRTLAMVIKNQILKRSFFRVDVPTLSVTQTLASDVEKQQLNTDVFRLSCVSTCIQLVQEFSHLYCKLPASATIFADIQHMLAKLPIDLYPQGLQVRTIPSLYPFTLSLPAISICWRKKITAQKQNAIGSHKPFQNKGIWLCFFLHN
jgi:hypothetical protein